MHPMMPAVAISPQDAVGAWPQPVRRCVGIGSFVLKEVFVAPGASFASFASRFAMRPRCIAAMTWVERGFLTVGLPEQPLGYLVDANRGHYERTRTQMAASKNSALGPSAKYSIQPEEPPRSSGAPQSSRSGSRSIVESMPRKRLRISLIG